MADMLQYQKPEFAGFTLGPGLKKGQAFDTSFGFGQGFREISNKNRRDNAVLAPFKDYMLKALNDNKGSTSFDAIGASLSEPAVGLPGGGIVTGYTQDPAKWEAARLQLQDLGVKPPASLGDYTVLQSAQNQTEQAKLQYSFYNRLQSRAYGAGAKAMGIVGDVAASMDNAEVVATMPFGATTRAGSALLAVLEGAAGEAAINAVTALPAVAMTNANLQSLDLPKESVSAAVLGAAAFGAVLGGTFRGVHSSVSAVRKLRSETATALIASKEADKALLGKIVQNDLKTEEMAAPSGDPASVQEAMDRADSASLSMITSQPSDMPERPTVATQPDTSPTDAASLTTFDPTTLKVEPQKFQFKSDVVASGGVTKALLGVKKWVNSLSGRIIVFEYKDGTRSIVDGHQRVALASRIMKVDPSQKIRIPGEVMRAVDGFKVEDARVAGALKNIAEAKEGLSGKLALDAAKIFRIDPKKLHAAVKAMVDNMPDGPGIKKANELTPLSEDAFSLVLNRVIPENYGAAIGRMVENKAMHEPIARLLEKTRPDNITQAESIIEQAMRTPVSKTVTSDLFGDQTITESLFLERAKVLDRAMKLLREDRSLFKTLTEDAARAEAIKGNKLNRKSNEEIRHQIEQSLAVIQKNAHRAGPISEALNEAAKAYKKTGKVKASAEIVARAVRNEVQRNGLSGSADGTTGRGAETHGARQDAPNPAQGFSDPVNGPSATEQVAATRLDANERPKEAGSADVAGRADLRAKIDAGASRSEIDAHPVVVKAIADMESRPETQNAKGFNSAKWHEDRVYIFNGEKVVGTDAATLRWADNAEKMAWVKTGRSFPGVKAEKELTLILGPPASGKSTIANEIAVARGAAIVDADEIKSTLPEYDNGIGAGAVHEESSQRLAGVENLLMAEGKNIVFPKVGAKEGSIAATIARYKQAGYSVRLVNMAVSPENAYKRMIGRFIDTGRLIPPSYVDAVGAKPSKVFRTLKKKGVADGYAEIDNNVGLGQPKPVSEIKGENPLAGANLDIAGRTGQIPNGAGQGQNPKAVEATPAGQQTLIDGVAPITQADRLASAQARPLQGGDAPAGGLFDDAARNQMDLLDFVPLEDVNVKTGDTQTRTVSRADLAKELDAEDNFVESLGACLK